MMLLKKLEINLKKYNHPLVLKNLKKNNKNYIVFFNIISFLFLFLGRFFYVKSLIGCKGTEFSCLNIGLNYIFRDIYYCILSNFFFLIFLLILQLKLSSFYNFVLFLFIIIELIIKDHGSNFYNHGILNIEASFVFLLFGEIIIIIFLLIIRIIKKKIYILFLIIIFIFILIILLYYKYKDLYYCKNWDLSLNNTIINNDQLKYACSVIIPKKKCLISIIGPFLDFSKIFNIKCENHKKSEKFLLLKKSNLKNIKNINKIGFPITIGNEEELKGKAALYARDLYKHVMKNLINMNNLKSNKKYIKNRPEVFVDYNNNPLGELKIKINFNKKLSLERQFNYLKRKKNTNDILFIYLDNLSRVHFYRQYKKTCNFLKAFFNYKGYSNKIKKEQKYHGFEFLKYHKFLGGTLRNSIPMFDGIDYDKNNTMISIVKDLKKVGYITCNVQDVCHKELMHMENLKNYVYVEYDHEYASPNCDPNVYTPGVGLLGGENGILRKCLYGKESIEYSLEYGKKFWIAYKYNKKFLRIVNTYGHEYTGEKSKYADDALYKFLNNLYTTNQLENTTVFLAGDHGFILLGIYEIFDFEDYKNEYFFPILILLIPDKKK